MLLISGSWCHVWIMRSVSSRLVVTDTELTFSFSNLHSPSIGFWSGLLAGQGSTSIPVSSKYRVTAADRWHGAPSCIKTAFPSGHHWSICGWKRLFSTCMYWSDFIVPSTTCNPPVPWTEMDPHIMILAGCFTVCLMQSGWYCSPRLLLTYFCRSCRVSTVDSSVKITYT